MKKLVKIRRAIKQCVHTLYYLAPLVEPIQTRLGKAKRGKEGDRVSFNFKVKEILVLKTFYLCHAIEGEIIKLRPRGLKIDYRHVDKSFNLEFHEKEMKRSFGYEYPGWEEAEKDLKVFAEKLNLPEYCV